MPEATTEPQGTDPQAEQPTSNQAETDWQAKFNAQQKVNRDLEAKFNLLRDSQKQQQDAFAQALGLKPEETSDVARVAQQVADLQKEFTATQHENTVLSVANAHGISDVEDLKLLRAVTDPETMRVIAARIAKQPESSHNPGPRPDLTQGGKPNATSAKPADAFAGFLQKALNS